MRLLVWGASGAIGQAVCATATAQGWQTLGVARHASAEVLAIDANNPTSLQMLKQHALFDAVVWAQGANLGDNVATVSMAEHLALYEANCGVILTTLKFLLAEKLLAPAARLVVVSSIWQNINRPNKLSYSMSKAALAALVRSAAIDLAPHGHVMNAVLPGVLDTPMTRQNLSAAQLQQIIAATPHRRLATVEEVASVIGFLCSPACRGMTGQFLTVDHGFSFSQLMENVT